MHDWFRLVAFYIPFGIHNIQVITCESMHKRSLVQIYFPPVAGACRMAQFVGRDLSRLFFLDDDENIFIISQVPSQNI